MKNLWGNYLNTVDNGEIIHAWFEEIYQDGCVADKNKC